MTKRLLVAAAAAALLTACQPATSGTSYYSAPNVGNASSLPATGATPVSSDAALDLLTDASDAYGVLLDAAIPDPSESWGAAAKSLTFSDVRTGKKFKLSAKFLEKLTAKGTAALRSAAARDLQGSKTPQKFDVVLYDSDSTKVGSVSGTLTSYEETNPPTGNPIPNHTYKSVDHLYVADETTAVVTHYVTPGGDPTFTLSGKEIDKITTDLTADFVSDATGTKVADIITRGYVDLASGVALSVRKQDGATSVGAKFVFSFAAHQVINVSAASGDSLPDLVFTYTIKGYDDNNALLFTIQQNVDQPAND